MRIGYFERREDPFSLKVYTTQVSAELERLGIELRPLDPNAEPSTDLDLLWEPGISGTRGLGSYPQNGPPVVATVHGAAPFVTPWREYYASPRELVGGLVRNRGARRAWERFGHRVDHFITVSGFARSEVSETFGVPREKIAVIHHGVDHSVFCPDGDRQVRSTPYFLVVAQYQPVKNLSRLFAAHRRLHRKGRPDLIAVLPGFDLGPLRGEGIHVIDSSLSAPALAAYYRGALGFVLPSLHETFCLPMVEAMACACPVITSKETACPEIASDAGILVDPRDVREISLALQRLADNPTLCESLRDRSRERARCFSWEKCASEHLALFKRVRESWVARAAPVLEEA